MLLEQFLGAQRNNRATMVEVLADDGSLARSYSYGDLARAAGALAAALGGRSETGTRVGLLCANSPEWVVADLALLACGVVEIPVPLAFTAVQAAGMLASADICIVDAAGRRRLEEWAGTKVLPFGCKVVFADVDELLAADRLRARFDPQPLSDGVCKIVHTSGTTSQPKGVLIRRRGLDALLESLEQHVPAGTFERYLSLVPFSLLIEQVAGVYMVARAGGTIVLLPPSAPLLGTAAGAAGFALPHVRAARPSALVVPPVMVESFASALAEHRDAATTAARCTLLFGRPTPAFLACGGAPVAPEILASLEANGIAVYEGYGLSENSSVVAWNTPRERRIGSVGRPLAHVEVRLADDGELLVSSTSLFAGYTIDDPSACAVDNDGWLHTGDYARIDDDGYLHILGRKKNVIITSAGRNVSPEWTEAPYKTLDSVADAVVFGDGLNSLHGLFVIDRAHSLSSAAAQIAELGRAQLSEIERVHHAHIVHSSDELHANYFTVTGRPIRDRIRELVITAAQPLTESAMT